MVIEKLREQTRQAHEELESVMQPQIRGLKTEEEYARLLHLFYGYYRPLELGVERYINASVLPDINERRKTSWIINDLRQIGQDSEEIRTDALAPSITDRASALGALYVMEGSSLGGKLICKMIAENLDRSAEEGLSFFNGYGGQTGSRWKSFLAVLDQYSDTPDEPGIVASANAVFSRFKDWLHENNS